MPKSITGKFTKGKGATQAGFARVPDAAIKSAGQRAGLSKAGIGQVKFRLGQMRVNEVANALRNSQGSILGRYVKGSLSGKRIGRALLMGGLGADTLAQSTSFQASKTEGNVIFGQMSKSEGLSNIDQLQTYNNMGKGAILAAAAISPAAIPLLVFGWASTKSADNQLDKSRQVIENL